MISFEKVVKAYEGRRALDDATFQVEDGEFCIFVGPSGAGKSTALRLINRMIAPDGGTIRLGEVDIATLEPVALRRRLGYVIQSIGLFPHWSVARNIATVPSLLGWPKERIRARVDELLVLVDLDPATYRDRPPNQLSGGQQQRVGLARALAADPQILLMDEPFGALDAVTRDTLQGEMIRIRAATGKTILMVTHDIDEAVRLATRIVVFENGQVVQNARPAELLSAPANDFVRALVGGRGGGPSPAPHPAGERIGRPEWTRRWRDHLRRRHARCGVRADAGQPARCIACGRQGWRAAWRHPPGRPCA
ncbi:MAG: ABC transporter ATP-binding protein [Bauldia sp.]